MPETIHQRAFPDLDVATLYDMLALRARVFVVEQDCVYLDPDGRDVEPGAVHWWAETDGALVATLRVLREPDGWRIGRVVTDPAHRTSGIGGRLLDAAVASVEGPIVLGAQSRLQHWYEAHGFSVCGPEYDEDDIPHVPMRLDAADR